MSNSRSDSLGNPKVLEEIRSLLKGRDLEFRELTHPPTKTSEESARIRGEPLEIGGKALVLKVGEVFKLFVVPANRRLSSSKVKQIFGVKRTRFATKEWLVEKHQLIPGGIPPFGHPVLPFDLFMDDTFKLKDRIAFNAGMLTTSIILKFEDYLQVSKPTFIDCVDELK